MNISDFAVTTAVNLTKKKEGKKKKKHFKAESISTKKLISEKKIKKTKKAEYTELLGANLKGLCEEIRKLYIGKKGSKVFDDRLDLIEVLTNDKFSKCLFKVMKEMKDSKDGIPNEIIMPISDMIVNKDGIFSRGDDDDDMAEICKRYMKIVDMKKGKEIKKLAKELKLSKDDMPKTTALALILTSFSAKNWTKNSVNRALSFLDILYGLNDLTEKKVKKAIKACYGKNPAFIIGIALNEKYKKDNENFGIVTNAILSMLEKMDKEDRNEILKKYGKRRREKGCQCSRRLNLLSINEDDYKNIHKSISKFIRNGFKKEIFS